MLARVGGGVLWVGAVLAIGGILMASIVTLWGAVFWIRHGDFPGPLFLGGLVLFVLGLQGFLMAVLGEYLARIPRASQRDLGRIRDAHLTFTKDALRRLQSSRNLSQSIASQVTKIEFAACILYQGMTSVMP